MLKKEFKGDTSIYQAESSQDGTLLVVLDTRQDERVLAQATARELVNRVQKLRKRVGLKLTDVVEIYYETVEKGIQEVRQGGRERGRVEIHMYFGPILVFFIQPFSFEVPFPLIADSSR